MEAPEDPSQGSSAAAIERTAVELQSNTLRGVARLTNQNPEILSLLATDPWRSGAVTATSTSPSGLSSSSPVVVLAQPTEVPFELQVEAGAGGDAGVLYSVTARRGSNNGFVYGFPPATGVRVRPRSVQPAPTEVTLLGCVGVIRFEFGTDATCQTPVPVSNFSIANFASYAKNGGYYWYLQGGTSAALTVNFSVSTPVGDWAQSRPVTVTAACDEVVRHCIVPNLSSSPPTGGLTGPFEIQGEPLRITSLSLTGPSTRTVSLTPPLAPVASPSSWWKLENLIEGSYALSPTFWLRSGREFTLSTLLPAASESVPVTAGQLRPVVKEINGELRYPFVMQPAHFYGSIRLEDPFLPQHPGSYSALQTLVFGADEDSNGDGIPNNPEIHRWTMLAAASFSSRSYTAFPGAFQSETGVLASRYDQVLGNTYDLPKAWVQQLLRLSFSTQGLSGAARPGLYDPEKFRYGGIDITPTHNSAVLGPGQRMRVDHEYCFSEVELRYDTPVGRLYNPAAAVTGDFQGTDWRGVPVQYSLRGTFWGVPAVRGVPGDARQYATPSGSVTLALPQGSYTLTPQAALVSDSGAVTVAQFSPLSVTLGCGQRLKLVPPLSVIVNPQPGCAASGHTVVTGVVKSRPAGVDRIWYRMNGGSEVTLCTSCGVDPSFSFPAELQACGNELQVFAFSEGMSQPAFGTVQTVWDDREDGPSCPGTYCVNRPPVALCRSVTAPVNSACAEGTGSVDDGSYDRDPGDTVTCEQTPAGPYPVGTHRVTLTCTDSAGLSSSCEGSVTVRDLAPPQLTCPVTAQQECVGGGASASYAVSATDNCGGTPSVACSPASGSTLPPGSTPVTCTATDAAGNRASCSFTAEVVGTGAPSLVLHGSPELTLECGVDPWVDPGATATDGCSALPVHKYNSGDDDGDGVPGAQDPDDAGPGPNTSAEGTYPVQYLAWNAAGVTVSALRTVHVNDSRPPTLALRGSARMTHPCGSPWVDPGVEAADACYGELSATAVRAGYVNGWAEGTYTVTYMVTDGGGNSAPPVTRTVEVVNCPW